MGRKAHKLAGRRFGRLEVLHRVANIKKDSAYLCKCDCGIEKVIRSHHLTSGKVVACGCYRIEQCKNNGRNLYKHGMSNTPTHGSWLAMKCRCTNKNHKAYHRYGGRGITICTEWNDFQNFYDDMGDRPEGKSIDRINNDKGYYKKNCRWATQKEQANNTEWRNQYASKGG